MAADSINIPRDLRAWKRIEAPKYKKDYEGKLLRATRMPCRRYYDPAANGYVENPDPQVPDGSVLTLRRRYPNGGGKTATLVCDWLCPACGHKHERDFIDTVLDDGSLHFVEEDGLVMDGQFLYLASPYFHPDPKVREERWLEAASAAAWLMSGGGDIIDDSGEKFTVFSPIAMGHPISVMGAHQGIPAGFDYHYWQSSNQAFLDASQHFIALQIEGWESSLGMREELAYARKRGLGIWAMGKGGDGNWGMYLCPDLVIAGPKEAAA